jgi:anthranilate phosphoribosyltransferase
MALLPYLHKLLARESLSTADAREAMSAILRGEASTALIASFAVALRMKGETAEEMRGLAQAMRESAVKVEHGITGEPVLDTCGTGGDGQGTLNVSTIAAFVIAGAGVRVAKHGNRSTRGHCGSADLLEALGGRLLLRPDQIAQSIRDIGFGFLFAPALHPAMKHAAAARQELKTRTAFNLLGPLTNPAGATVQLAGAPDPASAELMAVTLAGLGLQRGYVVHGHDGMDEVSTTGPTHLFSIMRGAIDHRQVSPEEFGLRRASLSELQGSDTATNKTFALSVLTGEKSAARDIVLANASVALHAAGKVQDFREGTILAAASIDSGAALDKLRAYVEFTNRAEAAA